MAVLKISLFLFLYSFCSSVFSQSEISRFSFRSMTHSFDIKSENFLSDYKLVSGFKNSTEKGFDERLNSSPSRKAINELSLGYRLAKDTSINVVGMWSAQEAKSEESAVVMLDPYTKLSSEFHLKNNFLLESDLRVGIPVAKESEAGDKVVRIATQQRISFRITSRIITEAEIYLQHNVHRSPGSPNKFEFRYEPIIRYEINDRIYSRLSYESRMLKETHSNLRLIDNTEPVVKCAIGLVVSKQLEIIPFIDVESKKPETKTLLYAAQLNWKIL